jgi:hypothetical protein
MGTVSRQCLRASGQHLGGKTLAGYRTNTERSQPKPDSSRMTMEGKEIDSSKICGSRI